MAVRDARREPRLPLTLEVRFRPLAAGGSPTPDAPGSTASSGPAPVEAVARSGRTENVATGGAFVRCEGDSPAVGAPLLLEIDAPSLHTPVEIRGEVRWVKGAPDGAGGFGVRFIEADRRASAAISALLEAKQLVDTDRPVATGTARRDR